MNIQTINYGWKFYKGLSKLEEISNGSFISVSLPHTWNNFDGQDGGANYFRGTCAYLKTIDLNKKEDKEYYLEFKGVNSIAKVYVNDTFVIEHKGGFSTFRTNVTKLLNKGLNTIIVFADNSANDFVYPQTADFTFFGGIYRDVNLLEVNPSRFDLDYFGSEGVKVTPILNENKGLVNIEWFLTNVIENQEIEVIISYNN